MRRIPRIYQSMVNDHLQNYSDKIILLAGPRQVGKTTLGHMCLEDNDYNEIYLNWDLKNDREKITGGLQNILKNSTSPELSEQGETRVIYFDELHKYGEWKSLLRGYHTELSHDDRIIVTGSASMESYKRGGESLKGISLLYHVFPITVAELVRSRPNEINISEPAELDTEKWKTLLEFGGFPDPFLHSDQAFYNRWSKDRDHLLFEVDLKSSEKAMEVETIKKLAEYLKLRVKHVTKYNTLADALNIQESDIKRFITQLESHYYCFSIQPWHKKKTGALRKNPKIYLWDWSELSDRGARYENMVAVHLKKAIDFWNDNGGKYDLFYLIGNEGEVDFLATKDNKPWLMVEVKSSRGKMYKCMDCFKNYLGGIPHVLQVIGDMSYQEIDCFEQRAEIKEVPMITFLSQLV